MQVPSRNLAFKLAVSLLALSGLLILFTPEYLQVAWIEARTHLPIGGALEIHGALDDAVEGRFSTLRSEVLFEILGDDQSSLEERIGASTLLALRFRPQGKNLGREPFGALVAYLLDTIERFPDEPVVCLQLYEAIRVHRLGERLLDPTLERDPPGSSSRQRATLDPVSANAARRELLRGRERDPDNGAFAFELADLAIAEGRSDDGIERIAEAGAASYVTYYQSRRLQAAHRLLASRGLPAPESKEFVHAAVHLPSPSARGLVERIAELARQRFAQGEAAALDTVIALFEFGQRYRSQSQTLLQAQLGFQLSERAIATFVEPYEDTDGSAPAAVRLADLLEANGRVEAAERVRESVASPARLLAGWRQFLKTTDSLPQSARWLAAGHGYLLVLLLECLFLTGLARWARGPEPVVPARMLRPLAAFGLISLATALVIGAHQLVARPARFGGRLNQELIDALVLGAPWLLAALIATWRRPGSPASPVASRAAGGARVFGSLALLLAVAYTITFPIALEQRRRIADEHDRLLHREASFVQRLGV